MKFTKGIRQSTNLVEHSNSGTNTTRRTATARTPSQFGTPCRGRNGADLYTVSLPLPLGPPGAELSWSALLCGTLRARRGRRKGVTSLGSVETGATGEDVRSQFSVNKNW